MYRSRIRLPWGGFCRSFIGFPLVKASAAVYNPPYPLPRLFKSSPKQALSFSLISRHMSANTSNLALVSMLFCLFTTLTRLSMNVFSLIFLESEPTPVTILCSVSPTTSNCLYLQIFIRSSISWVWREYLSLISVYWGRFFMSSANFPVVRLSVCPFQNLAVELDQTNSSKSLETPSRTLPICVYLYFLQILSFQSSCSILGLFFPSEYSTSNLVISLRSASMGAQWQSLIRGLAGSKLRSKMNRFILLALRSMEGESVFISSLTTSLSLLYSPLAILSAILLSVFGQNISMEWNFGKVVTRVISLSMALASSDSLQSHLFRLAFLS